MSKDVSIVCHKCMVYDHVGQRRMDGEAYMYGGKHTAMDHMANYHFSHDLEFKNLDDVPVDYEPIDHESS